MLEEELNELLAEDTPTGLDLPEVGSHTLQLPASEHLMQKNGPDRMVDAIN